VTLDVVAASVLIMLVARAAGGRGPSFAELAVGLVGAATVIYVIMIGYRLILVMVAQRAPVIGFTADELEAVPDQALPLYSILVPLYREENVLPALIAKLSGLDYPADRLQVLLLIEQDDEITRAVLDRIDLDSRFEIVLIPPTLPRTKPKACNVGLRHARGDFCVVFDAEDRPEPDQLRKAVSAFRVLPSWVVCVQAELQYWNPWTNWLTRCFAAEYALHFSLVLRGLDRFRLPIPLGGTSNHFRAEALRELGAWDPYNVTEDADLGMRIARRGWSVRMMNSVTEEEANARAGSWIRQRSRWTKGYYQTWLVHMRSPWRLWRELGARQFFAFQLGFGFASLAALMNPVFWALTCVYLVSGPAHISRLFPAAVLYLGVFSLLIGNLMMIYSMMAGCMDRGLYAAVRTMLAIPLYWALMSIAAYKALIQLIRPSRRHYWELTQHGLVTEPVIATEHSARKPGETRRTVPQPVFSQWQAMSPTPPRSCFPPAAAALTAVPARGTARREHAYASTRSTRKWMPATLRHLPSESAAARSGQPGL
jgi:glycosyltransferase XagB